ncbi:MAG: hypothetical protein WKF55_11755 [Gemmatimonadaceae bacterium]
MQSVSTRRLYLDWPSNSRFWFRALSLITLLASCSVLTTGPDVSSVSGGYKLEAVDGQPLPVIIENTACPREIFDGELHLDPKVSNRRALYGIIVYARLRCDPNRVLQGEAGTPLFDLGRWSLDGRRVNFKSSEGYGDYSITSVDPGPADGLPGPTLVINRDGRQYRFRRDRLFGQLP